MKKKNNSIKKVIKKDPTNIIVPIISLLILIVSSFTIGIKLGILLFLVINLIYFLPQILKRKKHNTINDKNDMKKKKKKTFKILLLVFLILFIFGIIAVIMFFSYIVANAPDFNEDLLYKTDPTVVLDKNGKEIAKLGTEQRVTITYDELSETLIDAIVATEDSRFYEHKGVDWARFLKASVYQVLGKSEAGGASTLTMQVSKNAYTSTEASGIEGIIRKFTDIYMSLFKIEKNYTKEQIMEFYVNSYYLGNRAYGVEQASITYFGKSAKDLNLAESAMIAGLFQAPGAYDPYKNPEKCETRRKTVLNLMLRHGYINEFEYDIASKLTVDKIIIQKDDNSSNDELGVSEYQSFIDVLAEEVEEKTGYNPYTTSMIIYSTMDTSLQENVNNIMNGKTYTWENDEVKAGVAVTNVKTGAIVAIGGARNVDGAKKYNYAVDIKNQIGSTAKPIYDYGPAVEYMNWSPAQAIVDEPTTYSDGHEINNWDGKYNGFQNIRVALAQSRNIPALKTFKLNNKQNIIKFATNLGLTPEIYSCDKGYKLDGKQCLKYDEDGKLVDKLDANVDTTLHEAHSIGGYNGESPLTMAAAYAAFGNNGYYIEPYTFTEVKFVSTEEKYINEINKTKAMSEETAFIISDMLVTTAPSALGRWANVNGVKFAAKTGTTNFDDATMKAKKLPPNTVNDLWVVGYNTEYSIGVWYGYDNVSGKYHNIMSSGQHSRLFNTVAKHAFTNRAAFTKPAGVVSITIETECPEPMYPSEYTPSSLKKTEYFKKGFEPQKTSDRFAKLNKISNLTATVDGEKIVLKWKGISTPEVNTSDYLKKQFSSLFVNNGSLQGFVNNRLSYIKNYMGDLGYNVYIKYETGELELLNFTKNTTFEYTPDKNGKFTFVVKSSYSKFKSNMSDGVNTNISFNNYVEIPDTDINDPETEEQPEDTNNTDENI